MNPTTHLRDFSSCIADGYFFWHCDLNSVMVDKVVQCTFMSPGFFILYDIKKLLTYGIAARHQQQPFYGQDPPSTTYLPQILTEDSHRTTPLLLLHSMIA